MCLVGKGFIHNEGIDYKETFSLISLKDSFRIQFYTSNGCEDSISPWWHLWEYLYRVSRKFGSRNPKNMICKLKKSIYELKQASRQWYFKFHQVIISFNFEMDLVNDFINHKFYVSKYIFLVLCIDDILRASNNIGLSHDIKRFLTKILRWKILVSLFCIRHIDVPELLLRYS